MPRRSSFEKGRPQTETRAKTGIGWQNQSQILLEAWRMTHVCGCMHMSPMSAGCQRVNRFLPRSCMKIVVALRQTRFKRNGN